MDKYDQDYFQEYYDWIQNRGEALKDDVDGILNSYRLQCKYIREHGCAESTSDAFPFHVMNGSMPTMDPNECQVAKIAR